MGAGKKMHGEGRAAGTGEAGEEEEGGGEGAKEENEREGEAEELGEEPGVSRRALCAECTRRWALIDSAGVCVMLV